MGFPLVEHKQEGSALRGRACARYAIILSLILCSLQCWSANLLTNADFEQGNSGFTSDFSYSPGDLTSRDSLDLVHNPQEASSSAASFTDHTSGSGLMLAFGKAYDPNNALWRQKVSVIPNTFYQFSGWAATWDCQDRPQLVCTGAGVFVDGSQAAGFELSLPEGKWQKFWAGWNSGEATNVEIELRLVSGVSSDLCAAGFAFDDLSFEATPGDPCLAYYNASASRFLEGDVFPPFQDGVWEGEVYHIPGGDGQLRYLDWNTLDDMSRGYTVPLNDCEFRIADCAPPETKGDGFIDVADVFEAFRKSMGLVVEKTPGGGPLPSEPPEIPETNKMKMFLGPTIFPNVYAVQIDTTAALDALSFAVRWNTNCLRLKILPAFVAGDIASFPFADQIKAATDSISVYLKGRLSSETLTVLSNFDASSNPEPFQTLLIQDLNTIIEGASIYETQRFAGVSLRTQTRQLLEQNPDGDAIQRLNRLLLEDAYPSLLSRQERKAVYPSNNSVWWREKSDGVDVLMLQPGKGLFHRGYPTFFIAFERLQRDCDAQPFLWGDPILPQAAWKGAHSLPCSYSTNFNHEIMELETALTISSVYQEPEEKRLEFYAQPFYTNNVQVEISSNLVTWSSTTNPAALFIPTNSTGNVFFRYSREMPAGMVSSSIHR
jgi:hypothetical protein